MAYLDGIDGESHPPLSEVEAAFICARTAMIVSIQDFASSVGLFEHVNALLIKGGSQERPQYFRWLAIASRDGALNIYHFGVALTAFRTHANNLPLSPEDRALIKKSKKTFDANFPYSKRIRDAVGHSGEMVSYLHRFDEHALKEDSAGTRSSGTICEWIEGDKFKVTHKGELISYSINDQTTMLLRHILDLIAPMTSAKVFTTPTLM